jgi:hypothetical protein
MMFSVPVTVCLSNRDGLLVEPDLGAAQALRGGDHVAVLDVDLSTHLPQGGDVQVDRARPDGAAARQGDLRPPEAGQQRPQHQDRGAHLAHQVVGGLRVGRLAAGGGQHAVPQHQILHPEVAEDLRHGADIVHGRHVGQAGGPIDHQHRRHLGEDGVLGAAHLDAAAQFAGAFDANPVHGGRL